MFRFNGLVSQPQLLMTMAPGMIIMMDGSSLIGIQTFSVVAAQQINSGVELFQENLEMFPPAIDVSRVSESSQ